MFDYSTGNKMYWMCLIQRERLFEQACARIPVGKIQAYYKTLLAVPAPASLPIGLKAIEYDQVLQVALSGGELPDFAALPAVPTFAALENDFIEATPDQSHSKNKLRHRQRHGRTETVNVNDRRLAKAKAILWGDFKRPVTHRFLFLLGGGAAGANRAKTLERTALIYIVVMSWHLDPLL